MVPCWMYDGPLMDQMKKVSKWKDDGSQQMTKACRWCAVLCANRLVDTSTSIIAEPRPQPSVEWTMKSNISWRNYNHNRTDWRTFWRTTYSGSIVVIWSLSSFTQLYAWPTWVQGSVFVRRSDVVCKMVVRLYLILTPISQVIHCGLVCCHYCFLAPGMIFFHRFWACCFWREVRYPLVLYSPALPCTVQHHSW